MSSAVAGAAGCCGDCSGGGFALGVGLNFGEHAVAGVGSMRWPRTKTLLMRVVLRMSRRGSALSSHVGDLAPCDGALVVVGQVAGGLQGRGLEGLGRGQAGPYQQAQLVMQAEAWKQVGGAQIRPGHQRHVRLDQVGG
jgi:hypothetical protein